MKSRCLIDASINSLQILICILILFSLRQRKKSLIFIIFEKVQNIIKCGRIKGRNTMNKIIK